MARAGMANLIQRVRVLGNVGTAEWTLGTVPYWSDDQIQAQLDGHRVDYVEDIAPAPVNESGTVNYYDYKLAYGNLEEAESGTAAWSIRDAGGTFQGTANYSTNYDVGLTTFSTSTAGSTLIFRYRAYDLHATAADIWRTRAANVALYYDIREGEHSLSRSQMWRHCMDQAAEMDKYAGGAGNMMVRMYRSDLN